MRCLLVFVIVALIACSLPGINEQNSSLPESVDEYEINDVLIKMRDGAVISGMVARRKGATKPRPVILQYTIYVRDTGRDLETIKRSVDNGYVGMVLTT